LCYFRLEYRQERRRLPAVGRLQGFSNSPSRPDLFLFFHSSRKGHRAVDLTKETVKRYPAKRLEEERYHIKIGCGGTHDTE
jgi:hypothetical protein